MSTPLNTIYSWFETGDFPTQAQFQATFSSFVHKDDEIPVDKVAGLTEMFQGTASSEALELHFESEEAHIGTLAKRNADNLEAEHVANWRAMLGITNIATVDSTSEEADGTVFTKDQIIQMVSQLQTQDNEYGDIIDQIREMLLSNDINLDELQEIVDFVKQNRTDIETLQGLDLGRITEEKVGLIANYHDDYGLPAANQYELNQILAAKVISAVAGMPKRFETTVNASGVLVHDLNTYDVNVVMYDAGTRYDAAGRVWRPDPNSVDILFDTPPTNPIKVIVYTV